MIWRLRPITGIDNSAADRRSVACAGDGSQSAVFRSDAEKRTRPVSRILLVLFPERACVPVSEHAISARLQYCAAVSLLAFSLCFGCFRGASFFPASLKLSYKPVDRAGRTRLLALCWAGFVLVFFTFSTTQEYYSMPVVSGARAAARRA